MLIGSTYVEMIEMISALQVLYASEPLSDGNWSIKDKTADAKYEELQR